MEVQYFGGNCLKIISKKAVLVVDDNLKELGAKEILQAGDIALFTNTHPEVKVQPKIVIDQPGEYEVSDVSVMGVAARAHTDEPSQHTATMYKVIAEDLRIAVVGHIYPSLSEKQLEALGTIDVLFVPVGGHGFTLDTTGALQVIKKIEPKIIIPVYYDDQGLNYPVPADGIENVIKAFAMEPKERTAKFKFKASDILSEQTQLIILERQ